VEVLEYGNIKVVATVGTGEHVKSSRRIVKIFDMALSESNKEVCRIPFETPILSLKITPKRLVIVLECEIHIYNTENLSALSKIATSRNKKGIVSIFSSKESSDELPTSLLAYHGMNGEIILYNLNSLQQYRKISDLNIQLQMIQFSRDGKLIASVSENGNVIKIFPVQEHIQDRYSFRRSTTALTSGPVEISSMAFDTSTKLFALSSIDRGTVHIFDILSGINGRTSATFPMFFGEEARSFAKVDLPPGRNLIAFSDDSKLIYTLTKDMKFSIWRLTSGQSYWYPSTSPVQLGELRSHEIKFDEK